MLIVRQRLSRKSLSIFVAILVGFVGLGLTPALAVDERVIDIVSVNWPGSIALPATVNEIAATVDTDVNARWKSYTTLVDAPTDRVISFKSGQVLAAPITLLTRMPCTGTAATDFINTMRIEAYKRLGIANYSKRYLIIAAPKAGCVWSGRAPMGGAQSLSGALVLHDSGSAFVIAHELGHTFGLGHSNLLRCDSNKLDGPWGEDCKAVEYGGVIDVMGNIDTNSTLNTYHQWRMGYLDDSQVKQVWQSETLTLSPSDFSKGLKAIYLRDGNAAYWIEYRRANPNLLYKAGLVVYRLDPPPISSVVSPNPEDAAASEFGDWLGTDVWMLNMDNYKYILSRTSGSMTTTNGALYSGNITVSATTSDTGAVVTIKRKADVTAPPVPALLDVSEWRYPGIEITKPGYQDAETAIANYQVSVDGVVSDIPITVTDKWYPTFLNPFSAPVTVRVRDLPEGSYMFSLRAIDIAGNKSEWSKPVQVVIDRARPTVTNDFNVTAINGDQISTAWSGAKDTGSGLCQTNLVNDEGLVLQSSSAKTAPVFKLTNNVAITAKAQVFDCIGNGVTGDLSIANSFVSGDKSSRTGKWTSAAAAYGVGALKCSGKCSASFSIKGRNDVLVGAGSGSVSIGTKNLATIPDSQVAKLRVGASFDVGSLKKVVRVSGSNLVLVGVSSLTSSFTNQTPLDRLPATTDLSLTDDKQVALSKFGFNRGDFSQEWTVLPMGGGTTTDDPTLDLCNATYASEKDRVERRQVTATKPGSIYSFLSTEVVKYSSASAAQSAQKELVKTLSQCQIDKGYKDATGALVPYTFTEIINIPNGVAAEGSRVFVRATIDSGIRTRQLLGFYQFNGAMLTGLYVMTTNETPFTDAQVATWLQVALTMASRLKG
ncbi:MAG: hypothetical protein F2690_01460 [Actinobacteria bacterium]|nr:hypothetical protein [Actinomycetota bacterium]MSX71468.1 hypothetical protein [Actinomycetota bacterium]MSY69222.1 hypothetical protein [Actinomycetota bacterium]MTA75455.1 hypothetical protein [Actinomycetota bacterium]